MISGFSSEHYFWQRDRLSIMRESKSIESEWFDLNIKEEIEQWDAMCKLLKEFSWEVKSFSSLEIISEIEEVSSELESGVSTGVSTKLEGLQVSRWKDLSFSLKYSLRLENIVSS